MKKLLLIFTAIVMTVFGTVLRAEAEDMGKLTVREQNISRIASLTATGDLDNLEKALNKGLDEGLTVNEVKEVLIQMYAYVGFPRSLNGINTALKVTEERKAKGINDVIGPEPETVPSENKYDVGKANVDKLFGGSSAKAPYEIFAPAIGTFLKEHLFCDIFERGVLSYKDREIATVSALASIEGVNPQLQGHINGALNTGVTEDEAFEIIEIIKQNAGKDRAKNAEKVLKSVIESRKK